MDTATPPEGGGGDRGGALLRRAGAWGLDGHGGCKSPRWEFRIGAGAEPGVHLQGGLCSGVGRAKASMETGAANRGGKDIGRGLRLVLHLGGLCSGVRWPRASTDTAAATPPRGEDRGGGRSLVLHLEEALVRRAAA